MSKTLKRKDKVNNFVSLPSDSMSSFCDRFIAFVRGVMNLFIDDESLKEYFYLGLDDNIKTALDTILGGSYGECTCAEIADKLEEKSKNNKAWTTRRKDTGRNTCFVHSTNNQPADEILEEIAQMRTELGLVLKHMSGGVEKVNIVNYLTRNPPPLEKYYYEEEAYVVNDYMGSFRPNA